MNELRIITLTENTAPSPAKKNLIAEWGLSFLLKAEDCNILFDAGRSISAYYNAQNFL